jgi:hypothetical protein
MRSRLLGAQTAKSLDPLIEPTYYTEGNEINQGVTTALRDGEDLSKMGRLPRSEESKSLPIALGDGEPLLASAIVGAGARLQESRRRPHGPTSRGRIRRTA